MIYDALIPARGGSERLQKKNLAKINDVSLLQRAIEVVRPNVRHVYVSTDDEEIMAEATRHGARIHVRGPVDADGKREPDRVIKLWWRSLAEHERPDAFVFTHCTYPLLSVEDVRKCVSLMNAEPGRFSAVHTVVCTHKHHFAGRLRRHADETLMFIPDRPVGHRPRTQGLADRAHEGGGCWVISRDHWEAAECRDAHYKKSSQVVIPEWRDVDIDTLEDLRFARALVNEFGWP